jgi:beta-mannanase
MAHLKKNTRTLILFFFATFVLFAGFIVFMKKRSFFHHSTITQNELLARDNEKVLGVYYKEKTAVFDTLQNFRHLVLKINNTKSFQIDHEPIENVPETQNILLTIEFWGNQPYQDKWNNSLTEIRNGKYNEIIRQITAWLPQRKQIIYIRINPEMEVYGSHFPWQDRGKEYIDSYRHVVLLMKTLKPELKFVWGPTGFMGAEEYYPGKDVVDGISITLKSIVESEYKRYPSYPTLQNEVHRKLHRLRFFDQPVMLIGSEKTNNYSQVYDLVRSEIDSVAKYRAVAYQENLWNSAKPPLQPRKFIMGLYDPELMLTSDPTISLEHIFVDFGQVQTGEMNRLLKEVFARNHDAILTVEPWRDLSGKPDPDILKNIIKGRYDSIFQRVYTDISQTPHTIYLRFAHEMEIPITRYAWQSQDPIDYILAFRYFMNFAQPFPANVKRIWGPAGDLGLLDFYPGDDVVDFVSLAIYGLPDKNITDPKQQESFATIFNRKKWRLRYISKPIFITEFGVKGPEDYKTRWLESAAKILNDNPQVIGINYFNMSDTPGAWGKIKPPDWRITPFSLHRFLKLLKRDDQ